MSKFIKGLTKVSKTTKAPTTKQKMKTRVRWLRINQMEKLAKKQGGLTVKLYCWIWNFQLEEQGYFDSFQTKFVKSDMYGLFTPDYYYIHKDTKWGRVYWCR